MPFYEYECQSCQHHTEVLQKLSDPPLTTCPACGQDSMRKLISAPVFRLKGSGWYETDFKSDGESKRNLAGADKEEAKSEAKSEAKGEAKPEAKPEAKEAKPAAAPAAPAPKAPERKAAPAARSAGRAVRRPAAKPGPAAAKGKAKGETKGKAVARKAPR